MRNKILIAIGLVGLMVSCIEEVDINNPIPTPGQEIQFSADLGSPKTRTLYGAESDGAVKVNWVNGDLISVYGTTCAVKQAEYSVKVSTAATPNGTGQNYADDLTKTGAAGVQWGEETTADFYAVYPSVSGNITPTTDGNGVVVPASIATQQYNEFVVNGNVIQGVPYNAATKAYGMDNALMYACTPGAASTDESGNPKKVDLRFKPYSTVLKFTIPSWVGETGSDLATNATGKKIIVNAITLQAPKSIAGTFGLHIFNDGTAEATDGTSKSISILPTATLEWEYNKSLEFSIFTIPVDGLSVTGDWTVTVDIANDTPRKFKLTPTVASSAKLVAGQIHEINVPSGFSIASEWEYSTDSWLTTVPRNVYISDLSLPGAWYATDSGYQGSIGLGSDSNSNAIDDGLEALYSKGVRAFNVDCRLTLKAGLNNNDYASNRKYQDKETHVTDGTLVLCCAGTEQHSGTVAGNTISSNGTTVEAALKSLGKLAADNPDEYIEVILTIAQKPKTVNYLFASGTVYGTVNAKMVLTAIANTLNISDVKQYLYGNLPGEKITPETTIDDVKGKVIVKVNVNSSDANIRTWNLSAPMLVSEGSMAEEADNAKYITTGNFSSMNEPAMYWSNNYVTDETNAGYMNYYYHHAQNTTDKNGFPSVDDRKEAIKSILSQSYSIYKNNTHDAMFQLGIGGWTSDNDNGKTNLSSQLKPYVLSIINSMLSGGETAATDGNKYQPAPVGAVLMNHATAGTTHSTKDLIDAIIKLNGKYFLNSDPDTPAWPSIPGGGNEENEQKDPNQDHGGGNQEEEEQPEV